MSEAVLYHVLRKLGITPDEAEKAVDDIPSAKDTATKADIKDTATKADIKDMATKADTKDMATKADVMRLEGEIKSVKEAIKSIKEDMKDMVTKADMKAEIAKLETRMTWKIVGIATVIIGIIKYL